MWQEMKTLRRGRCVCGAGKARAYWRKAHTATLGRRTPPKPSNGHRQVAVQRFFSRNRYKWIAKGQPNLHTNLETGVALNFFETATSKRVKFGIQFVCSEGHGQGLEGFFKKYVAQKFLDNCSGLFLSFEGFEEWASVQCNSNMIYQMWEIIWGFLFEAFQNVLKNGQSAVSHVCCANNLGSQIWKGSSPRRIVYYISTIVLQEV